MCWHCTALRRPAGAALCPGGPPQVQRRRTRTTGHVTTGRYETGNRRRRDREQAGTGQGIGGDGTGNRRGRDREQAGTGEGTGGDGRGNRPGREREQAGSRAGGESCRLASRELFKARQIPDSTAYPGYRITSSITKYVQLKIIHRYPKLYVVV